MKIRVALILLTVAMPLAAAEPPPLDARVGTLEKQMKAVQRKVFPGGDARFFQPEIAPEAPVPAAPVEGTAATTPLADLTARVDALEQQQRTLTGQLEEAQNSLRQLSDAVAKYRGDTDFRLNAIEHPAGTTTAAPANPDAGAAPPAVAAPDAAATRPAKSAAKPAPAKAAPPLPIEDQWRAAYAHYTAHDYPAAEGAMSDFLAANPKAARASTAQYWLGRSYLADGKPALGAKAFLDGYKNYPKGDRAADSLLWLGNALIDLKKPKEACQALDELTGFTGAPVSAVVKAGAVKARKEARCDA